MTDSLNSVRNRWDRMRIALTGQPVSTRNLSAVALPKRFRLPLFGADGISSVAYAADQMILTLAAAGASALAFHPGFGLGVAMVGLLVIGTYRYNINQIASEGDIRLVHRKLGALPSIVMGASSLMDYMLTVAVSMSSASSFLVALYPQIPGLAHPHCGAAHRCPDAVCVAWRCSCWEDRVLADVRFLGAVGGHPHCGVGFVSPRVLCRWLNRRPT